ncbi:MAG: hypothetical protein GXY09_07900 [Bacteroidales bacterium]|nr:hypothetical protein [Bacteroidales bacterium]
MKHVVTTLVMLALIGSALAQPSTTSSKETKRDIAFGTVVNPKEQVKASRKLAKELAKPGSATWRGRGDQKRYYHFPDANTDVPYRVCVPSSWDGKSKLPLVMFLHGGWNDESSYLDQNDKQLVKLADQYGFLLVSPLGYKGAYGNSLRLPAVYGRPDEAAKVLSERTAQRDSTNILSEKDVINVLELVLNEYPVDREQLFLTGHSMGSGGTWYLGAKYSQYWKALAPMSGPFLQASMYPWERIRKMPIFISEGTKAPASLEGSRQLAAWMKSNGFNVEYKEVDADHGGMVPLILPDVFDFFTKFRHQKSPAKGQVVQQLVVQHDGSPKTNFPLATDKGLATICFDASDDVSVQTTARLFAEDVERVTGKKPALVSSKSKLGTYAVIIGTIEKNQLINELVKTGKLATDALQSQWERYTIKTINNPFPGVKQALVIAGSDRRGTSYGVFSISETIGVSPWYWWADVPVQQRDVLTIKPIDFTSKSPSVKYRGIFINDEDWGLKPWSSNNYEKELGDIGPKTYAQVCELVLRLKGNMVAPAMHSCTGAFYSHPESKVAANRYGIIMTTSHCEPLLFNNAAKSEWDSKRDGEWNYAKNKAVILKKMADRVREASPYENIYTIAMRGVHDEGLRGNLSSQEKVAVLTQVMADQRDVLTKYLKKPATEIPQIFVPYKETMDVYELGLQVADDVTLVWVDDNYGYMKRLSGPEERKRSGGAGVYYHFSYLGAPHDYLWLNTTPPVLMYEELMKAYLTGADRYWLVNVGDIKPAELGMQTFLELAWDVEKFDYASINRHQSQFLARTFGTAYESSFQEILDDYYRLAWSRKPEFMGWEREWDAPRYKELANTDFSFQHYNDAQQRLADYQRISDKVDNLLKALPEASRPAFYELIAYPVMGACQMNRKFLMAQLNNELVKANNLSNANWAAAQAKAAYDSINSLTLQYNTLLDGKWDGMMALAPGWCAKYQNMPHVTISEGVASTPVDLAPQADKNKREGCTVIDLKQMKNKVSQNGHSLRIIEGLGYDGYALQLGEATEQTVDPTNLNGTRVDYEFAGVTADSVTVHVYSVPFWALHKGKSTRYGLTVDGQLVVVSQSDHKEYSDAWKDRVMQNSVQTVATFPVDKARPTHTFTLTCGDPGMIIQRVVIDWGGLKKTYVGPSALH